MQMQQKLPKAIMQILKIPNILKSSLGTKDHFKYCEFVLQIRIIFLS